MTNAVLLSQGNRVSKTLRRALERPRYPRGRVGSGTGDGGVCRSNRYDKPPPPAAISWILKNSLESEWLTTSLTTPNETRSSDKISKSWFEIARRLVVITVIRCPALLCFYNRIRTYLSEIVCLFVFKKKKENDQTFFDRVNKMYSKMRILWVELIQLIYVRIYSNYHSKLWRFINIKCLNIVFFTAI